MIKYTLSWKEKQEARRIYLIPAVDFRNGQNRRFGDIFENYGVNRGSWGLCGEGSIRPTEPAGAPEVSGAGPSEAVSSDSLQEDRLKDIKSIDFPSLFRYLFWDKPGRSTDPESDVGEGKRQRANPSVFW